MPRLCARHGKQGQICAYTQRLPIAAFVTCRHCSETIRVVQLSTRQANTTTFSEVSNMARYFVRCKVEDVKRNLTLNAWEWTRCEDKRMVEARFDHKDNSLSFAALVAMEGAVYVWGMVQ